MRKSIEDYLDILKEKRKKKVRVVRILCILSILVVGSVFWQLRLTGLTLESEASCGKREHTHTEACIERQLNCVYNGETSGEQPMTEHSHDMECYEMQTDLVCDLGEHQHDENCYQLICDEEHEHTFECYELVCGKEDHIHKSNCYKEKQVLICKIPENVQDHIHGEDCYQDTYICGFDEEHIHTVDCYSDKEADIETYSEWEKDLPKDMSGDWSANVVAVAQSQLGYQESERNFVLDDDGITRRGYTRYGEWYGNPYGNWNAMFVAFCLHYAGIPEDVFPYSSGAQSWLAKLSERDEYQAPEGYSPNPGDLVFMDTGDPASGIRVGVLESIDNDILYTIEGDVDGSVQKQQHSLSASLILGYGVLPPNLELFDVTNVVDEDAPAEVMQANGIENGIVLVNDINGVAEGHIIVYRESDYSGYYYYNEDGEKIVCYCYNHDSEPATVQGVGGFSKCDLFKAENAEPRNPYATKEMVATMLWLGYPTNASSMQTVYQNSDVQARNRTESNIWELADGRALSSAEWGGPWAEIAGRIEPNYYTFDLEYYSVNPDSPYYGQWGHQGTLQFSGNTNFTQQADGTFQTDVLSVAGTYKPLGTESAHYAGTFDLELPEGVEMYRVKANGKNESLGGGTITVPAEGDYYFVYNGNRIPDDGFELNYSYRITKGVYILRTTEKPYSYSSLAYQDFVSIETKRIPGILTLNSGEAVGYELPATGGGGISGYVLSGLLLMFMPLIYGYRLRNRCERRYKR